MSRTNVHFIIVFLSLNSVITSPMTTGSLPQKSPQKSLLPQNTIILTIIKSRFQEKCIYKQREILPLEVIKTNV